MFDVAFAHDIRKEPEKYIVKRTAGSHFGSLSLSPYIEYIFYIYILTDIMSKGYIKHTLTGTKSYRLAHTKRKRCNTLACMK